MLKVKRFIAGPIDENTFLVYDELSLEAIIIDPGAKLEELDKYVEDRGLKPIAILLTHGHADHWLGAEYYREKYNLEIYVSKKEKGLLEDPALNFSKDLIYQDRILKAEHFFSATDSLPLGLKLMETPGHSPGSVCFMADDFILSGDTIFKQGVGRWDLPGGGLHALINSVAKVLSLPDNKTIYPGHGPETDLEFERKNNPFVPYIKLNK